MPNIPESLKPRLARLLARILPADLMRDKAFFHLWQERGYHVTPVHFYEPVPDTRALAASLWERPSEMPGIEMNDLRFLNLLDLISTRCREEYRAFPEQPDPSNNTCYHRNNGFLPPGDDDVLYSLIRLLKPRRILEIGSGFSTLLMAQALRANAAENPDYRGALTCVDPYPRAVLTEASPPVCDLIRDPMESLPWDFFHSLGENDMLFVDSSHVVRAGSDVNRIILEIVPRLRMGVYVHFHDIFLPEEYPEIWIKDSLRFWSEQYLLQAFLAHNSDYEVIWPGAYMRLRHKDRCEEAFPSFHWNRNWMGSFWIRRITESRS